MTIKKCPFCGGEAETKMYLWGHHAETHAPIWCYYVYCVSCDAMTDNIFKSKEEAIAAWNRRSKTENEPLVRCGECERRVKSADLTDTVLCLYFGEHQMLKTDYCSYGKRKPERSEGE